MPRPIATSLGPIFVGQSPMGKGSSRVYSVPCPPGQGVLVCENPPPLLLLASIVSTIKVLWRHLVASLASATTFLSATGIQRAFVWKWSCGLQTSLMSPGGLESSSGLFRNTWGKKYLRFGLTLWHSALVI